MSATSIPVFDKTIEKTNIWLARIGGTMVWDDPHKCYMALRSVLHALRDRLPPAEAVQLAAQLPMLIRGFFYEGGIPPTSRRSIGTRSILCIESRKKRHGCSRTRSNAS